MPKVLPKSRAEGKHTKVKIFCQSTKIQESAPYDVCGISTENAYCLISLFSSNKVNIRVYEVQNPCESQNLLRKLNGQAYQYDRNTKVRSV